MDSLLPYVLAACLLLGFLFGAAVLGGATRTETIYVTVNHTIHVTTTVTATRTVTAPGGTVTRTVAGTVTSTTTVTESVASTVTKTVTVQGGAEHRIEMNFLGVLVAGTVMEGGGGALTAHAHALLDLHGVVVAVNFTLRVQGSKMKACISQEQGGLPFMNLPSRYTVDVAFYRGSDMVGYSELNMTLSGGRGCGEAVMQRPLPPGTSTVRVLVKRWRG